MEKISNIVVKFIGVVAIVVLFLLTVNSLIFSYSITRGEKSILHIDNFLFLIVFIAIFLFIKCLNYKKKYINITPKFSKILFISFIIIYFLTCILLVSKGKVPPKADQGIVLDAARNFKDNNFGWMDTYLKIYPNQFGIIMLFYIILKIPFVTIQNDILIINIINIIFLILADVIIVKISELIQSKKDNNLITLISLLLFLPLTFYITFIYGNIIGFSISTLALYLELLFFLKGKKRYILLSATLSAIAILVKSNFLIVLVAEVILMFFYAIKNKKIKSMLWIILFLAIYIISNKILNFTIFKITGIHPEKGMPKICWIDMGLQENPTKEAGWYDAKNYDSYIKNGYNYELANEQSKNNIKNRLIDFIKNPTEAISFFNRKVMSQWNEPTFESMWIIDTAISIYDIHVPTTVKEFFEGKNVLSKIYINYCNIIHIWILFGALCYFIIEFKDLDIFKISIVLVILGGVAFHMLWEAKSQYTITYFILFIPYAVIGYEKLTQKILEKIIIKKDIKFLK